MLNKISILFLIVFAVGGVGGCGPDLSNLDEFGNLRVHVDDQNGVPVNGVEVQISGSRVMEGHVGQNVLTDVTGPILGLETGGEVIFFLIEGTYTVTINPPDKFRVPAPRTVQIKAMQTIRVDVKLGLATVATN